MTGKLSDIDYIKQALDSKLAGDYSKKYKAMLQFSFDCLKQEIGSSKLSVRGLKIFFQGILWSFLQHPKRHLNVLINEAVSLGLEGNPMIEIKSKKAKAVLHKPFDDIATILEDIKAFNKALKEDPSDTFIKLLILSTKDEYYTDRKTVVKLYLDFIASAKNETFKSIAEIRLKELQEENFMTED